MSFTSDTPLWQLTVSEFMDLHKQAIAEAIKPVTKQKAEKRYVYGLSGLASLFGCSRGTAAAYKKSGKFDAAISQEGRKIVIDADLALELKKLNKQKI